MFFVIFWTALVRYTWLSNSSRFFFRQSVLSDVFGLMAPAVWAQRCGAGGCRREATWIWNIWWKLHMASLAIWCVLWVCSVDDIISHPFRIRLDTTCMNSTWLDTPMVIAPAWMPLSCLRRPHHSLDVPQSRSNPRFPDSPRTVWRYSLSEVSECQEKDKHRQT